MKKKIKRILFGVMLSAMLVATSAGISTFAASKANKVTVSKSSLLYKAIMNNGFLDYKYYADNNPDVVNVLGGEKTALLNHFLTYGVFEGRRPNANFDINAYSSAYEDVRNVFNVPGRDKNAVILDYYYHYFKYGINEGRNITTTEALAVAGMKLVPAGTPNSEYATYSGGNSPVVNSNNSAGNSGSSGSGSGSNDNTGDGSEENGGNEGEGSEPSNPGTPSNPPAQNKPNNGVNNALANSQHVAVDVKEGLTSSCNHDATEYQIIDSAASAVNNGYVSVYCDLCKTKKGGSVVHAYKDNGYYDSKGDLVYAKGWLTADYDNTTSYAADGITLSLINKINAYRESNEAKRLPREGSSQPDSNTRAIELAIQSSLNADTEKKPSGAAWNSDNGFQAEIQFCEISSLDNLWTNLTSDDAKKTVLLDNSYTAMSVACFHYFVFANGSNIPTEKVYWVINFK